MRPAAAALAAALGLSSYGCTTSGGTRPPVADAAAAQAAWVSREAALAGIDRFLFSGRVASAELGLRADLRWRQNPDGRFELRLAGPFGTGAVELRGDAQLVEVRSSEGSQFTPDPEGWIRSRYGWTLPIAGLRYWTLGLPAPGSPAQRRLDAQGRLEGLEQNGWQIEYGEYRAQAGYDLPRRFEASNGQMRLKLVIDRWEELPAP